MHAKRAYGYSAVDGGKEFVLAAVPVGKSGPGTLFLRFKLIEKMDKLNN